MSIQSCSCIRFQTYIKECQVNHVHVQDFKLKTLI